MRKIQMMGIDHSRATVAERELFSLTKAKQKELMEAVIRQQGVGGCVLLSTCNRTELYVSLQKEEDIDLYRIFCHIREIPQTAQDELQHLFCRRSGEDAVRHLFLLTGGLKSRIIGEDQILTQVREALEYARLCNVADTVLKTLFRMAVTVGKKIKTQVASHLYIDHTSQGDEKALQHGGPGHAEGVLQQLAGILCWLVQQLFCVLHPEAPPLYLC